MWQTHIPVGNREELAHLLYCVENPPGTKAISGSQDQLGMLLPGLNKLNYDNGYWPVSIESKTDHETLDFVTKNLWLVSLPQRKKDYDILGNTNINVVSAKKLADATERAWKAIQDRDVKAWGEATKDCFAAQIEMYPAMITDEMRAAIEEYKDKAYGWKVSGCGGGGYWILISDQKIPNAIKVVPCYGNN